jgi:hypothetical protein
MRLHLRRRLRLRPRLTYANVAATIALALAIGGPTTAVAAKLITGADIKNGTITGRDIKRESVSGKARLKPGSVTSGVIADGSLQLRDLTDGARDTLRRLAHRRATGPDITGYEDMTPIVSITIPAEGVWLLVARFIMTNTGASSDTLNCGFQVGEAQLPTGGGTADPGDTVTAAPVNVAPVDASTDVALLCAGSGVTTFDLADIELTAIKLA